MTEKERTDWTSIKLPKGIKDRITKIVEKEALIRSRSHFIDVAIEKLVEEYEKDRNEKEN